MNRIQQVTLSAGCALLAASAEGCSPASAAPVRASAPAVAPVSERAGSGAQPSAKPTLVVFITIDQMRGDYIQRWRSQLHGGLHRFEAAGAHFTQAYHDHAITETAPGHSVTMSGRFPVHTGITSNSNGVEDRASPLVGAPEVGASPKRFIGTTLLDWMRASDRNTKFLSVSRKDRAAILPIGKTKGDVYWYSANGNFTTSEYYAKSLPKWVQEFNARKLPAKYRGWEWIPVLPDSAYAEPDSVPVESQGIDFKFPHDVYDNDSIAALSLGNFPVMDELTLKLALEGVQQLKLGTDPNRTDLLNISLSTTDAIGHRYGPDSKELHDQILQVDKFLGAFMDSLFVLRDSTRIIMTLTGDHGMSPFPGVLSKATPNPGAQYVDIAPVWRKAITRMQQLGIDTNQVDWYEGLFVTGDTTSFVRNKVKVDSVARALDVAFAALPGVERADLLTDLAASDTVKDAIARRWLHMFDAKSAVRSVLTLKQFNYYARTPIATHGSPWDQDAWVPVVFWGAPFVGGKYNDRVRVVDMAPTLAEVLKVKPMEKIDGVVLQSAIRK